MIVESIIGYLAPKVTQYLFTNLRSWAEPVAKGVGCKVINYASDAYAVNRKDIEQWVRNVIPGEKFDEKASKAVDNIIVFAMQEIAEFIECEIKLHGLNAIEAMERAEKAGQIPAIFERISEKVKSDVKLSMSNF